MCFNSLGEYNNCEDDRNSIYPRLCRYMNNVIGKDLTVKLTQWNKPLDDEDCFVLTFTLSYPNDHPEFDHELNWDNISIDVVKNRAIKSFIISWEYISLSKYGG
ncbi:MAG: hypothetical protein ACI9J3_000712 [Parvicellaceae bacterium]|jgi:hypothetical protein